MGLDSRYFFFKELEQMSERIRKPMAALFMTTAFCLVGCGGGNGTLEGEVKIDDKLVPFGTVNVHCKTDNLVKIGQITNGSYRIDDLPQGEATITVTVRPPAALAGGQGPVMKDKVPDRVKNEMEKTAKENKEKLEQFKKLPRIPDGYDSLEKKWLTTTIKGGTQNFPIKMDSKKR
jgi:hypothetical protein